MKQPAFLLFLFFLCFGSLLRADPVAVRYPQGTTHGFLLLRDMDGKTVAVGDLIQVVRGKRIVSRLRFRFHDGSLDDETAEFTQHGVFRLLKDHHIQRGPSFPNPMEMSIDVPSGTVTLREAQKSGPPKVTTQHMDLPPDLANGIALTLLTNIGDRVPKTTLPYIVAYHGARLIHITITPEGMVPFRVGGSPRKAREFQGKADLGGLTGIVAPLVGKQPKDWHFLFLEGEAPAFVREEGQFFEDGPMWRVDQVGPVTH